MKDKKTGLKVLVFAPHPDDEVIGCGGSIIKHLQQGNEVFVVFVGDTTGIDCNFLKPEEYSRQRKIEIKKAISLLGLKEDNIIILQEDPWHYNEERLRIEFLDIVRKTKPHVCYIPHLHDGHVDHQVVNKAALEAINMAPSPWFQKYGDKNTCPLVQTVLGYEIWTPIESPNYFEPLGDDILEKKMTALQAYQTQEVDKYEHAYRGINAYRGAMHEGEISKYAEAFQIIKISEIF